MSSFPSIRIEGGLLGPELLDQVIAAEVPGQKPADFGLEPKRNLTDEIAAAFADSRALWGVFQNRLSHLCEADLATSMTRDSWVIPFLSLLGYELTYNQRSHEIDGQTFAISHSAASPRPSDGRGTKAELSTLNPQPSTLNHSPARPPQPSMLNPQPQRTPPTHLRPAFSAQRHPGAVGAGSFPTPEPDPESCWQPPQPKRSHTSNRQNLDRLYQGTAQQPRPRRGGRRGPGTVETGRHAHSAGRQGD